jgi:opacity protein-like surface antigen
MRSTKRWILSMAGMVLSALLVTSVAMAQGLRSAPIDVAVTYDELHTNHITSQNFWMQGGAVELGARAYHGLGIAARVEGLHAGTNSTTGEPLSLVTAVFGPRYTVETRSQRYVIFGEGLAGISNGFHSLFSEGSGPVGAVNAGTTTSSNALAVDVGGGLDVRLSKHVAIRVLRASYLRTQFSNSTTNVQNSLSLSSGLTLRFGK